MIIPKYLNEIHSIVENARPLGSKRLSDGTALIGRVPHVAPEAYLHLIFPPLKENEIDDMEERLGKDIPLPLKAFYFIHNGINLFSTSLSINGLRRNYDRQGDAFWQPFDLIDQNAYYPPPDAEHHQLFFGGYREDGSLLYLDTNTLRIYRSNRESVLPLNEWPSFERMLLSETLRLSKLFDVSGKITGDVKSALPSKTR